jgi:hypothetical protein
LLWFLVSGSQYRKLQMLAGLLGLALEAVTMIHIAMEVATMAEAMGIITMATATEMATMVAITTARVIAIVITALVMEITTTEVVTEMATATIIMVAVTVIATMAVPHLTALTTLIQHLQLLTIMVMEMVTILAAWVAEDQAYLGDGNRIKKYPDESRGIFLFELVRFFYCKRFYSGRCSSNSQHIFI